MQAQDPLPTDLHAVSGLLGSFTPAALFASIVVGAIGTALFIYGKKQGRLPHALIGLALGGFPIFVTSAIWTWLIGFGLCATLWLAVRMGY